MASHKSDPSFWRPSRVLGFLFCIAFLSAPIFYWWNLGVRQATPAEALDKQQLVVAFAAWAAVLGWIVTAITSIRNSVKQHTVNTLLQSRLSATYMERAEKLNSHFGQFDQANPIVTRDPKLDPTQGMVSEEPLRYILNYFEYIAIGIRYGDLHEPMLRSSLRSILTKTVFYSRFWIENRVAGTATISRNPKIYCNLRWLYLRWRDDEKKIEVSANDLLTESMKVERHPWLKIYK